MAKYTCLILFLAVVPAVDCAWGVFPRTIDAPVDRLIKNTAAFIEKNPANPMGYYTLARIHYLAFANKAFEVGVLSDRTLPRIAPDWLLGNREATQEKEKELENQGSHLPHPTDDQLKEHAAAALRNFTKAIKLEPNNALYNLGIASLLEQYVQFLKERDTVPKEFRAILLEKARDSYYTAHTISISKDRALRVMPVEGLRSIVAHEAGEGYMRLTVGNEDASNQDKKRLDKVTRDIVKLESLQPSMIVTPIIFSPEQRTSLADLLASDGGVQFDLDGDGRVERWPWVKPTTGILVWDPQRTGQITSGRQLFGTVTWWLFFSDGYHALDALDDNRDGELTGVELVGISVWFDRDSDGQADDGEVVPVEKLGITALATQATGHDGKSLTNPAGLTLKDGRTVPTYDWVVSRKQGATHH